MKDVTTFIYGAEPKGFVEYEVKVYGQVCGFASTWKMAQRWYEAFLPFGDPVVIGYEGKPESPANSQQEEVCLALGTSQNSVTEDKTPDTKSI